jgi:hypothetical protein
MSTGFAVGCFVVLIVGLALLFRYARSDNDW